MAMIAAAAVAAGIPPQARRRCAPNKKRIGCDSAEDIAPGWTVFNTSTGLSVEESVRMTGDRDKWRKYVHGMANPQIEDG